MCHTYDYKFYDDINKNNCQIPIYVMFMNNPIDDGKLILMKALS